MASERSKSSNFFMAIIMLMLLIGLVGFGIGGFGGSIRTIGSVGETEITVQEYQTALQAQLNQDRARLQQPLTFQQGLQLGIDQRVQANLVAIASLNEEAKTLGISVGDAEIIRRIQQSPEFAGPGGGFDRDAYEFVLNQSRISQSDYEQNLRESSAIGLLQQAVTGGLTINDTYARTLYSFLAEKRSFRWAMLTPDLLITPNEAPTQAQLETYYQENSEQFLRPEIREITYVWLTPDMLLDTVQVDETVLRDLYDARADQYIQPERRLVERLGFVDMDAAQTAKAQIDAGETTFDALVDARGLTLDDVDQGDVARDELAPAIADVIFALSEPGITEPVETTIGPAIYRINAVLSANETAFEDVREELLNETIADQARRAILNQIDFIDDLLVGGATLEELAIETDMQLGTIAFTDDSSDEIAGYDEFRIEAGTTAQGDFPAVQALSDGGIFALRMDKLIAPELPSLSDITDDVSRAWDAAETIRRLSELGETLQQQMADGTAMEALGLNPLVETDLTRGDFIETVPAGTLNKVFELPEGGVDLVVAADDLALVELTEITPVTLAGNDAQAIISQLDAQAAQSLAADVFEAFGQAVQNRHGLTLDQTAINAVHQQFQ